MGWTCGAYGWGEGVYRVLVGKSGGKRPRGRPRRRWVDNIRTDLQEVGCGHMDWIGLAQDRDRRRTLVSAVMNLRVPWNAGNFLTSCKPVSFSRRTLHHWVSITISLFVPERTHTIESWHITIGVGRHSSLGIATRYELDGPGIGYRRGGGRYFLYPSRTLLGPT